MILIGFHTDKLKITVNLQSFYVFFYQFTPFNFLVQNFQTFSKFVQRRKIYEFLWKKMSNLKVFSARECPKHKIIDY